MLVEENERQVETVLAEHPDFVLCDAATLWREADVDAPWPCHGPLMALSPAAHGTDGFFAAILQRAPSGAGPAAPPGAGGRS